MNNFSLTKLALACALASPFSSALYAQTAATEPSSNTAAKDDTKQLDVMVFTANRENTSLKETPAAISQINAKTIQDKNATFIGQLLNNTPGVYMTDLGNEQHMMAIRQPITTAAVYQYLEDGLSIRPVGVFNHNALYELNLAGVDAIEILRGPASSLYGSNAIGGTVNFLTKAPTQVFAGNIAARASSEGYRRYDLEASNTFGDHGLMLAGYYSERGDSWQDHAESDKTSLTLRHDWAIDDATQLKNIVSYNKLYTDTPGSLSKADFSTRPGFSYQTFTYREVEALRVSSQLSHDWSDTQSSQATVYYRDNTTDQNPSFNFRTIAGTPPSYTNQLTFNAFQSYGLNLQHSAKLGNVDVVVGAMKELSPTQAKTTLINVTRNEATKVYTGFSTGALLRDFAVDVDNQAIYTQATWHVTPEVHVVGGLRYDWIEYDYNNKLTPSSTTGAADETRKFHKASPKVGVVWNVTPDIDLYSNFSQGFVPPEVSSLYGANLQVPNLREATFNNYDLGARMTWLDGRLDTEVTLYRLDGKDELISYTLPNNSREPRNAAETRHEGIELGGRWNFNDALNQSIKLSGTFSKHTYQRYAPSATADFSGKTIPNAPEALGTVEYSIEPIENLNLSAEGVFVSSYAINDANTEKYQGHNLLNLRGKYRFDDFEVFGQILNVTDINYTDSVSFSNNVANYTAAAPRTYLLGIRYFLGAP